MCRLLYCIKDLANRLGFRAVTNQRRNARRSRLFRSIQLRRDAAGAKLALALAADFSSGSLNIGYQRNPLGIAIQSWISVINSLDVAKHTRRSASSRVATSADK